MASPGEEALRSQMADLSMALARNEALITLFSTTLQSSGVIPEAVGLGVANQHNNSISRASTLITACMSSVKITPDKFRLIVEALTKVEMKDSADKLLAAYREKGGTLSIPVTNSGSQASSSGSTNQEAGLRPAPAAGAGRALVQQPDRRAGVSVESVTKILEKVLTKNQVTLHETFEDHLKDIARELNQCDMITHGQMKSPSFDPIMGSIKSGMKLSDSLDDLEKYCNDFLKALTNVGGPVAKAAARIEKKWIESVKEEIGIELQLKK